MRSRGQVVIPVFSRVHIWYGALVEVLTQEVARKRLFDPDFLRRWEALWRDCGAGVFRSPAFVRAAIEADPGAPVVVVEGQGDALTGLLVLAPKAPGILGPPGGGETLRQGWLSTPLDGGYFIERAVQAVLHRGLAHEIHLERLPPDLALDWARSQREVGRIARTRNPEARYVELDAVRAQKPIEDKLHAPQLAAYKALGKAKLELDPPDASSLVQLAAGWHDDRCRDQGFAERYRPEPRRIELLQRIAGSALQVQVLRAGQEVLSVQAYYPYGKEVLLALAAEHPRHESAAPGLIHWWLLEPWLLSLGAPMVDVSAGPVWLGLLAGRRAMLESVTLYGRRRDRLRGDARAAMVSLSRWALSRIEG